MLSPRLLLLVVTVVILAFFYTQAEAMTCPNKEWYDAIYRGGPATHLKPPAYGVPLRNKGNHS